jgi:tRNA nucleotidyltransferase/poly(A) polymerase
MEETCIVNKNIYLDLPKQVLEILDKLASYSYSAYIYGECVRLLIKGQTPFEYSVMTDAEIPRLHAIFDGYNITANTDNDEAVVTVLGVAVSIGSFCGSDLKTELQMKQAFTFNALAYSVDAKSSGLHDFWGGYAALKAGEIAFIEGSETFNPLDILPALMLYADGEFTVSESANQLILAHFGGVVAVREEIEAVIMGRNARDVLSEYSDIFTTLIPELKMLEPSEATSEKSRVDLLAHSFRCVGLSTPDLTLRYALLFCELGKPDCYARAADGSETYRGHTERARIYAVRIMTRLGCSEDDIIETADIIENHEHAATAEKSTLMDLKDEFTPQGLKLLLRFNHAVSRANSDEKAAMKYKKLIALV